jgi:Na+-translocating ferredoxin:NAD+ oxidoreductase RnfA subunit
MDKLKLVLPNLVALIAVVCGFLGVSLEADTQTAIGAALVAVLAAGDSVWTLVQKLRAPKVAPPK